MFGLERCTYPETSYLRLWCSAVEAIKYLHQKVVPYQPRLEPLGRNRYA
jgi:hypothetical protein